MSVLHQGFAHPLALWLLVLLPALGVMAFFGRWRRRRALIRLGRMPALAAVTTVHPALRLVRGTCRSAGLTLVILGIAGPQWGREPEQATAPDRDLVVVLDMSRSMLADDVLGQSSPNRLGRAKDALADLVDTLQQRGGYRVALVAFAARSFVACPLTHDYDHFQDALAQLDPDDPRLAPKIGSEALPSGTRFGQAIVLAVKTHDQRFRNAQDILMISDGDDPVPDDEWRKGVAAARDARIPVHTVGVGDPEKGGRIPVKDGYLHYQGQVVWTRLQEDRLQEIARRTKGVYAPARTRDLTLGKLFLERMASQGRHKSSEDMLPGYQQHYAWFIGPALMLLAAEMAAGQMRRRRARQVSEERR